MTSVADLVPHEPPMLALDELVGSEPGKATARTTVRAGGLLVRDGALDAVVTLEHMAQTVAACLGSEATTSGGSVRVGMVIACRTMTIHRARIEVGEVLTFEVTRVRGTDDTSQFDTVTRDAQGALVSEASMTLVHPERLPGAPGVATPS